MSGVYIPNMEMPKRCEDCFCYRHNYDHAYCNISSTNVLGHGNARLNNCPLIPIPPHGRLVDADALFEKVYEFYGEDCETAENWMMGKINDAPTIIEAEGGAEE